LLDFGAHALYTGYSPLLDKIAKDILSVTNNHLHVVALTHQHQDHISGFHFSEDVFESNDAKIDQLWLAWPENDQDPDAKELIRRYPKRFALKLAYERLETLGRVGLGLGFENILGFEGSIILKNLDKEKEGFLELAARYNNQRPYEFLIKKAGPPSPYLEPKDEPLLMRDVDEINFFILGPTRDISCFGGEGPSEGPSFSVPIIDKETSILIAIQAIDNVDNLTDEDKEKYWRSLPFERGSPYRVDFKKLKKLEEKGLVVKKQENSEEKKLLHYLEIKKFFDDNYGFSSIDKDALEYRKIDNDWIAGILSIALKNGEFVNNSSLVFAIELSCFDEPKYLLFVGDAQEANWNSWKENAKNIIGKTIFYKTGHHGSHNATLPEVVDKMPAGLVAMISVDEDWAHKRKPKPWDHPDPNIMEGLKSKTKGKILRTDQIPNINNDLIKPPEANNINDWNTFKKKVQWDQSGDKLWIQYTISKDSIE